MEDSSLSQSLSSPAPPQQLHDQNIPSDRRNVSSHVMYGAEHVRDVGSNGAKYKLMSPAKLPISRSTCITIPPGLSPTSFLESPVLLSNIKAEPSPTTGSFFKPQIMQGGPGSSVAFSLISNSSNRNPYDERNSSHFEFKPHSGSTSVSGLSSVALPVSAGFNLQESELSGQVQDQCESRSYASSALVNSEMAAPKEPSLSAPAHMLAPMGAPAAVAYHETNGTRHSQSGVQLSQSDHKDPGPSVPNDRSSDDGYNWRKYGQKVVKGSEFPRSYYKCTHPNCEVKKIFERSYAGQITEIVYKGTHDHPKPQPSRRFTAGALMSIKEEKTDKLPSLTCQADHSGINAQNPSIDTNGTPLPSPKRPNDDSNDGAVSQLNNTNDEVDDDDPFSKRRRTDFGTLDVTPVVKPIREPRVVVQTVSEVDILDDGYRWRKYGQKVVRGNPNPRSYYKCTNAGCPVRKHVERASHDPKAVITTYEGKHNHDVPTARTSSHDASGPTVGNGMSRIRSEEDDRICLDLGVGNSFASENKTSEQPQTLDAQTIQNQMHDSDSNFRAQSACYGIVHGGMDLYSRANNVEGHSFDIQPLNHSSNPYPQNLGRILLGP